MSENNIRHAAEKMRRIESKRQKVATLREREWSNKKEKKEKASTIYEDNYKDVLLKQTEKKWQFIDKIKEKEQMSLQNKANRIQDMILKQELRGMREKQIKDQIE